MILIYINNQEYNIKKDITILNAAQQLDIQIPIFCYNEKQTIAGNCRMCLVEVKGLVKLVVSCTFNISEGMEIFTDSVIVKQARESVLEFLLVNHPLDCPICDQGGECDLQDLTLFYGRDRGRFYYNKRAISDISLGLLVSTSFNRCIQCTKCVRFLDEIAHYNKLGIVGRSKLSMIEKFIDKNEDFNHELLGNIVDICPVGALTSKIYNFKGRKYELQLIETIDLFDSLGSNIYIETRESLILRILPKINYLLNEEWLSDKTRYNFDGFFINRIQMPSYIYNLYYYLGKYNFRKKYLRMVDWSFIFNVFKEDILYSKNLSDMQIIFGNDVSLDLLIYFKKFYNMFNLSGFFNQNYIKKNQMYDSAFCLSKSLNDFENHDLVLIVGSNLVLENVLLSIRLRKLVQKGVKIYNIGPTIDTINGILKLGNNLDVFFNILNGKHFFCFDLLQAKNPLILITSDRNLFIDSFCNHFLYQYMIEVSAYINFLSFNELGYYNPFYNSKLYYLLHVDGLVFNNIKVNKGNYIIYQGTHFDFNFKDSDLILPSNLFIEEEQFFLNYMNVIIKTIPISLSKTLQFKNSSFFLEYIIKYFYSSFIFCFNYNNFSFKFTNMSPFFYKHVFKVFIKSFYIVNLNFFFNNLFSNYYLSDIYSRNSLIMRKLAYKNNFYIY